MRREDVVGLLKDWGIAAALTLAVVGALRLAGVHLGAADLAKGDAPPLVVPAVDGTSYDLTLETADVVVVNFWATWCGPCRQEIPEFTAFAQAHPEIAVLGVSVDEDLGTGQLAAASTRLGIRYKVLHDADQHAAVAWGVTGFPTTFVLDREHHVVEAFSGTIDRRTLETAAAKASAR